MKGVVNLTCWVFALAIAGCGSGPSAPVATPRPARPPAVTGRLYAYQQLDSSPPGSATFGPEAIPPPRFHMDVSAQRRLTWLGFALSGTATLRDSVPAPVDTTASATFDLGFPPGTRGVFTVTAFARDSAGGYGDALLVGNPLSIYDTVTDSVTSVLVDIGCTITIPTYATPFDGCDLAIDPKRDVVYLSEPDSSRITVLSLASMTYGPAIAAPATVAGLDVTPSDDSLIVALPTLGQLGIVDLTTLPPTWHVVDLSVDTLPGRKPAGVRVAATNRVLVSMSTQNIYQSPPPPPDSTQVVEYDLGSGTARARFDVGRGAGLSTSTPLTRSADASRILLSWVGTAYQSYQLYRADRDTLLATGSLLIGGIPAFSLSASGGRFLIKGFLFDQTGSQVAYVDPPGDGWVSALSPAGDTAYFGFGASVLRTRLADRGTTESVLLPEAPTRLDVLPGGTRLLARGGLQPGGTRLYLIKLNARASPSPTRPMVAIPSAPRVRSSVIR